MYLKILFFPVQIHSHNCTALKFHISVYLFCDWPFGFPNLTLELCDSIGRRQLCCSGYWLWKSWMWVEMKAFSIGVVRHIGCLRIEIYRSKTRHDWSHNS